jgi:hypothetical protein
MRGSDMSDNTRPSDPGDQEQLVERRPRHEDPTRVDTERTSDASTIVNGGLGGGRPEGGAQRTPERVRAEAGDKPVKPDEGATLKTNM